MSLGKSNGDSDPADTKADQCDSYVNLDSLVDFCAIHFGR